MPTHYEPRESPVGNALYPGVQYNPVLKEWRRRDNPYHAIGDPKYPYVVTTYRLTEHHAAGAMSRQLPVAGRAAAGGVLRALAGAGGREGHPQRRLGDGRDGARRDRAARAGHRPDAARPPGARRFVHQLGIPYHFGYEGEVRGDSANDLPPLVADPNVTIHEGKAFTVQHPRRPPRRVRAGRARGSRRAEVRADAVRQPRAARARSPAPGAPGRRSVEASVGAQDRGDGGVAARSSDGEQNRPGGYRRSIE